MNITEDQKDGLAEVINIGVGRAADSLNRMLGTRIEMSPPLVRLLAHDELDNTIAPEMFGADICCTYISFDGVIVGKAAFALPMPDAMNLVSVLTDEPRHSPELDAVMTDAIKEVGNVIINNVMGSVADFLKDTVDFTLPGYAKGTAGDVLKIFAPSKEEVILFVQATMKVRKFETKADLLLFVHLESFSKLLSAIDRLYTGE